MDMHKLLSAILQALILIPGAASCYLAAKDRMKFSYAKTAAFCAAVLLPYSIAATFLHTLLSININIILFPSLILFFFLYRRTINMDMPRSLAIYVGVCSIETFPAQFAYAFSSAFLSCCLSLSYVLPHSILHWQWTVWMRQRYGIIQWLFPLYSSFLM